MQPQATIAIALIVIISLASYNGFKSPAFIDQYKFNVDEILIGKDYKRLITSGFIHGSWMHLIFNISSLYSFASFLEIAIGSVQFFILYILSLLGGNLLALYIHRQHGGYSAVGASGAVLGVVFATIVISPLNDIGILFLPLHIPSWLFGTIYLIYTIIGIKKQSDNIGHEAHLGGAVIGLVASIFFIPQLLVIHIIAIIILMVPVLVFLFILWYKPHFLLVDNAFTIKQNNNYSIDHRDNEVRANKQKEIDALLEKIKRKGISSLTSKEKQVLDEYSK